MKSFHEGYDFFLKNAGYYYGAEHGADYINAVDSEINKLINDLNAFEGYKTDSNQLQGDIAEFWHADTFNINAVLNGSSHKAFVDRSHDLASADVSTNFNDKYGLKYYKSGVESAKAQAKSIFERYKEYQSAGGIDSIDKFLGDRGFSDIDSVLNDPIYTGQKRLIPRDQLLTATEWLKRKIATESFIRPEQVKRYQETLDLLCDRIKDNDGNESIPLSREDSQRLAVLAKQRIINAKEIGLSTDELVTYGHILQQSFKAGMTAATITAILKVAPEIIKAIDYLLESGEIDRCQFEKIGLSAISGTTEGFVRGAVSSALTVACKEGLLGETFKMIEPSFISMAVVIAIDTMKSAYKVATGKMSEKQMADELVKETFIASVSLISGTCTQMILPIPVFGFMLGSFVGSVVGGVVYTQGYNIMLSFCIDTGFTMFGLVSQDYTLPEDVLKDIGIFVFEQTEFSPSEFEYNKFEFSRFEPSDFSPTTIYPYFIRRGVIGIREIGYNIVQ